MVTFCWSYCHLGLGLSSISLDRGPTWSSLTSEHAPVDNSTSQWESVNLFHGTEPYSFSVAVGFYTILTSLVSYTGSIFGTLKCLSPDFWSQKTRTLGLIKDPPESPQFLIANTDNVDQTTVGIRDQSLFMTGGTESNDFLQKIFLRPTRRTGCDNFSTPTLEVQK